MRWAGKHPNRVLGVYLEVCSVFGYVPKQTEWGPRSRIPQTATVQPYVLFWSEIGGLTVWWFHLYIAKPISHLFFWVSMEYVSCFLRPDSGFFRFFSDFQLSCFVSCRVSISIHRSLYYPSQHIWSFLHHFRYHYIICCALGSYGTNSCCWSRWCLGDCHLVG